MILLDMEQGSPEWMAARIGIPTASNFNKIVTPSRGELSKSSGKYMCQLVAEWLLGTSLDEYVNEWMERGNELEPDAVRYYELHRDIETTPVGFILREDGLAGASPDRLVGDKGGLEIKCPKADTHVSNILHMTEQHRCQVQGGLWLAEREWWDLMSYHPEIRPAIVRIDRDEQFIDKLSTAVDQFIERLEQVKVTMIADGYKIEETQNA